MDWIFGLLILIPLFSSALLQVSEYSVMFVSSSPHWAMSYAYIIAPSTFFLTSFVNTTIRSRNSYWLMNEPWWSPTSTPKLLLSPATLRITVLHPWYMSWISLKYFPEHFVPLRISIAPPWVCDRLFFLGLEMSLQCSSVPLSVSQFRCENRICRAHNWQKPKLTIGALYHHLVHNLFPYFKSGCSQYNVIKCNIHRFKHLRGAFIQLTLAKHVS